MTATLAEVQKWREAHPGLPVAEDILATAGPFPSLHVNDFVAYLQSKGAAGDVADYVRDLGRETAWAYGNWQKSERDSKASALLSDMLNAASPVGEAAAQYAFVQKFIRDYAKANGIRLDVQPAAPTWGEAIGKAA